MEGDLRFVGEARLPIRYERQGITQTTGGTRPIG